MAVARPERRDSLDEAKATFRAAQDEAEAAFREAWPHVAGQMEPRQAVLTRQASSAVGRDRRYPLPS